MISHCIRCDAEVFDAGECEVCSEAPEFHACERHYDDLYAAARREGVIEGLLLAVKIVDRWPFTHIVEDIRAEVERIRSGE